MTEQKKIFLNTKGTLNDVDEELRNLLDYFESLIPQDAFTVKLDEAVMEARLHKGWRREYMKLEMMMRDSRKEGRTEGIIELVCRKLAKGKTPEAIADDLEEDLVKIQRICDAAAKYAPDFNIEKILQEFLTNA